MKIPRLSERKAAAGGEIRSMARGRPGRARRARRLVYMAVAVWAALIGAGFVVARLIASLRAP